ncbi:MAG TPA: GlsB/YeaQ/YmgE family stress response membrane protein [Armatimonadota bacterium]|nr:GlsB/YeaQ/YmgE family stress response membrane protein [Armatimonadota bacterium]
MGLVWALIMGAIVGVVARGLAGGHRIKGGCLTNILIGIVGSVFGSILVGIIGGTGVTGVNLYSFGVSLLGAVVFLWVARAVSKR